MTNKTNIPTNAGRFWIGLWFPNGWADCCTPKPMENPDNPTPTPVETELIKNGDFALDSTGWDYSGETFFENGKAYLSSGAVTDTLTQFITVKPNTTYKLVADIDSSGAVMDFGVRDYAGKYTEVKESVKGLGEETITFTTGSGITEITVFFEVIRYQSNEEVMALDNVELIKMNN